MTLKTRVLLVEDHPLMRTGIKSLIAEVEDFAVIGEAASLAEARPVARSAAYDLALLDISLPDGSGMDLINDVIEGRPERQAIILTMHNESPYLANCIRLGASGYVVKDMAPERLIETLRRVRSGEKCFFITQAEAPRILDGKIPAEIEDSEPLSPREIRVRDLLVEGKTLTQIAAELDLSVKTVFTYRVRLLKKLGLKNNAELIRRVVESKL